MLDIKLSSLKKNIKADPEEIRAAYQQLKKCLEAEAKSKAYYAKKGLKKPEIVA